jgi:N,N'-diacetylbacillosaminyl-diphospho-undecaprenol alpha-1,3-N-acetylgalactosaminyltransferase
MKIAIICSYDFSIAWSLEIFVKKLLKKNEVTVICDMHDGHEYGYYTKIMEQWGVTHKYVKTHRFINPIEDLKYISSIYRILNNENYDILINVATKPNIYGSIVGKWIGVKKIVCFGWGLGLVFAETKDIRHIVLRYIMIALYRYAFGVSHKLWFTNKNDLNYLLSKKAITTKKTLLTPGFVDTKNYSPASVPKTVSKKLKHQLGYLDSDKIVIMVARMSWAKGVKQFCEASDQLRDSYPNVKFLLVGQEDTGSLDSVPISYLKSYEYYANFSWLGYRVDIKELYSIAYLAVFPSYYREGGWPRGLTEPMAMGKPVITTNSEHCSSAVDDGSNGLIIPIKDSNALANAIKKIVNDKILAKTFGIKSREKAVNELDEEFIMNQLINFILK